MERLKPDKNNYFHCQKEGCDFISKKRTHLIKFKGLFLCCRCKLKASKCLTNLPTLNIKDSTLKHYVKLNDIGITQEQSQHMPKERYKDYKKITPELKEWANKQEAKNYLNTASENGLNKGFWVGLSKQERQTLYSYFYKQGMDELQIMREIDKIKQQITFAHNEFKKGLKTEKSFKEEFNKLVNK